MNKFMGGLTLGIILTSCFFIFVNPFQKKVAAPVYPSITNVALDSMATDTTPRLKIPAGTFTKPTVPSIQNSTRDSIVVFAKSLLGVPYLYGSTDPARGFDCSGFINYVFNRFKIAVPRSSYEFANKGIKKTLATCSPGDVILFTGTDPLERTIGHIGIVADTVGGNPSFIHSSSGKANGVTITSMDNKFYQDRFISVNDLLK